MMTEAFLLLMLVTMALGSPNFIILMADDAGYADFSVYGSPTIHTPNLDQFAAEGVRFTQWYAPAAVCTPSRGATLTGRLPGRIGLYSRFNYPADYLFRVFYPSSLGSLPANETTIAGALKNKGYYSAAIGKWHLGHYNALPTQRGFDYFYGTPYSHDEGYPGPFPMSLVWPPVPLYQNEKIIEQPLDLETLTEKMTQEAVNVIETNAAQKKPFFLYMSYHEPHIPLFHAKKFEGVSRRGKYGDMIYQMDDSIGTILDKLKQLGIDNNTLVVFTSDNGAWPDAKEPFTLEEAETGAGGSNGQFKEGKGSTWEGGVRTPAIVRWPGRVPAGEINLEVATHMDLFPTFLGLAGVPLPSDRVIDGKDLAPLLFGETQASPHEFIYYWRETHLMAIRYGPYKLHFETRSGFGFERPTLHDPPLFYNIEVDPGELHPLSIDSYPEIVDHMLAAAEQHKQDMVFGSPQYDFKHEGPIPGQSWQVIPCCQRDLTQLKGAFPPDDWSLIVWKDCICPGSKVDPGMIPRPEKFLETSFLGQQLLESQRLVDAL